MKKISFQLNNLKNRHFLTAWIVFHAAILLFFGLTFIFNRSAIKIDADLFNMFPRPFQEEGIRNADEKLTEVVGQNVFILVADKDFSKVRQTAASVYDELNGSDNFNTVSLYSNLSDLSEVTDFMYKYRWNLLSEEDSERILNGGEVEFAEDALMQAFSPFTLLPLDNLDTDPFMLTETSLNSYLTAVQSSGTAMTVKDGVLASYANDTWYVMIRGILSKKGAALASKDNGITEIYKTCGQYEKDGTRFVYSGTPFNSHQSSNSATKEITIISTVSMLAVIIILFIVFKSPVPILLSVLSILISIVTAICTTLAVFHKMHILTLVFGTSLIGSCIDYSLHYFTHWAGNEQLNSGEEIRSHLLPGLIMAIVSSVLCFAILLFAPFNLLKQMALFSVAGLISSFLTTVAIYPYIPLPSGERKIKLLAVIKQSENSRRKKIIGRIGVTALFTFTILTVIFCFNKFKIHNDVNKLYTMEGRILDDKIEATQITKYNPSGWFIIRGNSEEEALLNEQNLCSRLTEVLSNSESSGFISTTLFIPTIESQKKSRLACRKLLELAPMQFEALGFDPSCAEDLRKEFDSSENDFISLEKGNVPDFIRSSISTAWLGKMEDGYYTVVMPNIINDAGTMKEIAEAQQNVFFVSKIADMGSDLDNLTNMILKFFLAAYVVMFIVLKFFYNWKQSLKIISIPLLIILVAASVFVLSNTNLEFFSVTGLILVFGLGLDYIIYMMENEKAHTADTRTLEPFAILLSFVTTVISFGALALSTFVPVHLMGLSIFIGLSTAYASSMLYDRSL